ncbi:hypothetical protein [uncultured Croceitalea sp.]|uniref:hypothetical protein n=1 Tax=uncultured Croceitalea sp. TaxID=1798908 RepID=UPI003305B523
MKTLELHQMENIEAGSCGWAAFSLGVTFAGAFLVTGPVGAALFASAFIRGSISVALAC